VALGCMAIRTQSEVMTCQFVRRINEAVTQVKPLEMTWDIDITQDMRIHGFITDIIMTHIYVSIV